MIDAFAKHGADKGDTGPFWVGSGLAIFSALVTFFFIRPLSHDGMTHEDIEFRRYLEENGYDTSQMGLFEETSFETSSQDLEKEKDPSVTHV